MNMQPTPNPDARTENPLPQGACAVMSIRDLEDLIESIKKERRAWGIKRVSKNTSVILNIDISRQLWTHKKRYLAKITRAYKVIE